MILHDEINDLFNTYVVSVEDSLLYPGEAAGKNHRPMLSIQWTSLTEDFEKSLDLVLEVYARLDYSKTKLLSDLTAASAGYWDPALMSADDLAYDTDIS